MKERLLIEKPRIAIAPKEFCFKCTYQEAILYCFSLNIDGKTGWRLPTYNEYSEESGLTVCWWMDDEDADSLEQFYVVPVRDIT